MSHGSRTRLGWWTCTLIALATALGATRQIAAQGTATYNIRKRAEVPLAGILRANLKAEYTAFGVAIAVPGGPLAHFTRPNPPHDVPQGGDFYHWVAHSIGTHSEAKAETETLVADFSNGGDPFVARVRAFGFADVEDQLSLAFAASRTDATVFEKGILRDGTVEWAPLGGATATGGAIGVLGFTTEAGWKDPIDFRVFDPDAGTTRTGTLASMEADIRQGAFSLDTEAGIFSLAATEFDFLADMSSPYTSVHGTIEFRVRGGLVVASVQTGIFAGLLPGVGASGTFDVPFPSVTFGFDLGPMGPNSEVSIRAASEGFALVGIPEPSTAVLLAAGVVVLAVARWRRAGR